MTALVRKDPRISKKLLAAWRQDERAFQDFFDKFERINIKKLKDHSLVELYRHYYHLAINRLTSSAIIDHFALGTDVMLADLIRKEIGRIGKESDFTRVFSVLSSPIHQSFISEAEMQMIKIVIEVKKTDIKAAKNSIEKYQQKYFWIKNNYINAQVLTVKHFQREVADGFFFSVWIFKADLPKIYLSFLYFYGNSVHRLARPGVDRRRGDPRGAARRRLAAA